MGELGQFALNLTEGELNDWVKLAGSFCTDEGSDAVLKNSLELNLRKLASTVMETRVFMEKNYPGNVLEKLLFTISGERRARELNKTLIRDKQELCQTLLINHIHAQGSQKPLLLTHSSLVLYRTHGRQAVLGSSNLFTTRGDYRDGGQGTWRETDLVTELFPFEEIVTAEETIATIVRLIHRHYSSSRHSEPENDLRGSLPCLGYRMEPDPELVFLKPKGNLMMLHNLIAADQDEPRQPLDVRFQLARSLTEAVLGVHVQGLVHKNIRTNTILLVERPVPETGAGSLENNDVSRDVYLTNWNLLRDVSGATIMSGGTQWAEDMYRHPRRQGMDVQERYNIGHDIYSLGVCLLEIGLWNLLIRRDPTLGEEAPPQASNLVRAAAGIGDADSQANDGDDAADRELRRKLRRPNEVQNILLKLARDHLPQRMGRGYCRLVVACLTVLDQSGGFREGMDWKKMSKTEQGIAFREFILSFFTDMSALFEG
ncbi:hypothetical protein PG993_004397 [Apiospora rasikravindrae]|uniref:Protein kinase domain-containing protein n=1 Tax=Apiospora rasikravindrae TaxID=990691 RepID=A0ABR1TFD6_9PEZI